MNELILRSCQRGFVSQYVSGVLWALLFAVIAIYCSNFIDGIDWRSAAYRYSTPSRDFPVFLLYIGKYAGLGGAGIIVLVNLHTVFYGSREVNTFYKQNNRWHKVRQETYHLPAGVAQQDQVMDRITNVSVVQSLIDKMLNTGSLSVQFITFVNAESDEETWTAPAIPDPFTAKKHFDDALAAYDGMPLKISKS